MTVILEADGFADLLERTEFMQRVSQQDARIIDRVRDREGRGRGGRAQARPARGRASARSPRSSRAATRRSSTSRTGSSTGASSTRACAPTSTRRSSRTRARTATTLEGHLAALEKEQAKVAGAAGRHRRAGRRGPDPPGLRRHDLADQRHVHVAVRDALGPAARGHRHRRPGGHADPRGRLRHRRPRRLDRRLRQLHLHRRTAARSPRATGTSRAIGTSVGANVSQGQVIGYVGQHRPLVRRRTCTSRSASTACRVDPMGYL